MEFLILIIPPSFPLGQEPYIFFFCEVYKKPPRQTQDHLYLLKGNFAVFICGIYRFFFPSFFFQITLTQKRLTFSNDPYNNLQQYHCFCILLTSCLCRSYTKILFQSFKQSFNLTADPI